MRKEVFEEMRHVLGFKSWWPHQSLFFEGFSERLTNSSPIRLFLSVPCGWGKTEAAIIPFLSQFLLDLEKMNQIFSSRMIYVLPSCVLVDQVANRTHKYISEILRSRPENGIFRLLLPLRKVDIRQQFVEKDYGFHREPPAEIYGGIAITTTIDSFSARLFPSRLTKPKYVDFVRGKLLRSYLVFDEIHSYDLYTLGFIRGLLSFLNRLITPHVIMTATLNENQQKFLGITSGTYSMVKERKIPRECSQINFCKDLAFDGTKEKFVEKILALLEDIKSRFMLNALRILIVCNTVLKAQHVYKRLKSAMKDRIDVEIIHSRYTSEDRRRKVHRITKDLLKRADEKRTTEGGIVVTTQVIESGTDISADCLITEIAPPDALIQRIGRCARELRSPVAKKRGVVRPGNVFVIPIEVNDYAQKSVDMRPYPWYWMLCAQATLADTEGYAEATILERLIDITPAISQDNRTLILRDLEGNLNINEFIKDKFGACFLKNDGELENLLQDAKQGQREFEAWLRFRMMIPKPVSFPKVRESERLMILVRGIDKAKETAGKIKEAKIEAGYKKLRRLRRELKEIEEKCAVPVNVQAIGPMRSSLQLIKEMNAFFLPKNMYIYDRENGLILKREEHTNG